MPKNPGTASASTIRQLKTENNNNKKRKNFHPTSSTTSNSAKSVSRLHLDDIFSSIATDKTIESAKEEATAEKHKKKKSKLSIEKENEVGAGPTLALNLLLESKESNSQPSQLVDEKPRQPPSPLTSTPTMNIEKLLKNYKLSLRTLLSTFNSLQAELELIDRIWYKNSSQFRTTFWWKAFNSFRRCLHSLFLQDFLTNLCLLYAGIGGGMKYFLIQKGVSIPKFGSKPSFSLSLEFLTSKEGKDVLKKSKELLAELEKVLEEVRKKAEISGKVLIKHLNTPPAPTFTPLVVTILALIANVDDLIKKIMGVGEEEVEVDKKVKKEEENAEKNQKIISPMKILNQILHDLTQQ